MADQSSVYISFKLDGILGESEDINHKGWMACDNWSFSVDQDQDHATGKLRGKGTAATGSFSFGRTFDKGSPKFLDRCSNGLHITKGVLEAQRTGGGGTAGGGNPLATEPGAAVAGGDAARVYFRLRFQNLVVVGTNVNWSGEDTGMEHLDFAFEVVEFSYLTMNADGTFTMAAPHNYNTKTHQVDGPFTF